MARYLAGVFLLVSESAHCAQDDGTWGWSLGFEYGSGDYGGSADTDILYIPLTARYDTGPWSLRFTLPYLSVTGPGNVIRDVGRINGAASRTRTTESGIGDVIAAATYNLLPGGPDTPIVDLTGKLKLPTADSDKRLGTGEADLFAQVDVYQPLRKSWTGLASLGYAVLGNAPGTPLNDVFYGSVGASHQLSAPTSVGVTFDLRQSVSATSGPQCEIVGFINHRVDRYWRVQAYALTGFANGSPDLAIATRVVRTY